MAIPLLHEIASGLANLNPSTGVAALLPLSISPCEGERNYLLPQWGRIKEGGFTPCYQFTRDLQLEPGLSPG